MAHITSTNSISKERQQAIDILETLGERLEEYRQDLIHIVGDKPLYKIFDCKDGDTFWYDCEDAIVEILTKEA